MPVGTPVELIATVVYNNGDSILNSGVVDFCDETAASFTGSGLLAESEITNNPVDGTNAFAILNLGIGNHPILVIYRGTNGYQQSANTITVSVTGKQSTSSKIAAMGAAGDYTLNGTVTATGRKAPAGNLSFLDSSDSNFSLGSASLTAGKTSYGIDALSFQPAGPWPQQIAVADFNQDGIPDMAVINSNYMTYPNPGAYLQILYGDGKGGTTYITSVTLPETDGIAVGEFDRSGIPMIAVSDSLITHSVYIIQRDANDLDFNISQTIGTDGSNPTALVAGDFNRDGTQDLIALDLNGADFFYGLGWGKFIWLGPIENISGQLSIAAADFNGDGILDLATWGANNSIIFWKGNGDTTFTQVSQYSSASPIPPALVVADFNEDGYPDLAVSSSGPQVLLSDGARTFQFQVSSPVPDTSQEYYVGGIAAGDFDGDGHQDIAFSVPN